MKIYNRELKDGLKSVIESKKSFAYLSPLLQDTKTVLDVDKIRVAVAEKLQEEVDSIGLYPMKSILVSSVWNDNTDVFLKEEVFSAKYTPQHKPLNVGHSQRDIVGHMTTCYVIDNEGNVVANDAKAEALPDKIHIVANSYMYTHWYDKEQRERIDKLITDIKEKKYAVSMEAVFADFDYALKDKDNSVYIIPRNEQSSWMSKHLYAYGGKGKVHDYQIGRVLRNIVFNGNAIVEIPANPDSVIFSEKNDSTKHDLKNLGYLTSSDKKIQGIFIMEEKVVELEGQVKTLTEQLAEKTKKETELTEQLTVANKKLETIEKEKVVATREKLVVEKLKYTEAEAKSFVENLEALNDEKFTKLVEVQASKVVVAAKVEPVVEQKVTVTEKVEKVLDGAEPNKALSVASAAVNVTDESSKVQDDMVKFLSSKKVK